MLQRMLVVLPLLIGPVTQAQETDKVPFFVGINPSVTVEPFYAKGELDVGVLPIVFQRPVTPKADLRVAPILNLGIRNGRDSFSHFGIEVALPVFLTEQKLPEPSEGFFLAPVTSVTRNRIGDHTNVGLWLEPGYHFLFPSRFALSLGLQAGATHFNYDSLPSKWRSHFGIKVIFGKWR